MKRCISAKTKWAKVGHNTIAPSSITNVVYRVNPKSKYSRTLDLRIAWEVGGIDKEIFSADSITDFLEGEGGLSSMRSKLAEKLEKIELFSNGK